MFLVLGRGCRISHVVFDGTRIVVGWNPSAFDVMVVATMSYQFVLCKVSSMGSHLSYFSSLLFMVLLIWFKDGFCGMIFSNLIIPWIRILGY